MSNDDPQNRRSIGRSGFSVRAERLLVRALLSLRGEARRSNDPTADRRRAEELADVILADFPRRILPIGLAALVVIILVCSMPLLRDALSGSASSGSNAAPAAYAVERGIRTQGAVVGDGLDAIRSMVAPFAPDATPAEAPAGEGVCTPPSDAAAPYKKS